MKKGSMKVKPFNHQDQWTTFDNFIIDYLMPTLSPNAWKCLTVIIRKTIGWHKEHDELSFSQIIKLTGIRSSATVAKSLKELEDRQIIQVDRSDDRWQSNIYALNLEFEMDIKETPTLENEVGASTLETKSTSEIKVGSALEIKVGSALKNEDTKEILFKEKEKEIAAAVEARHAAAAAAEKLRGEENAPSPQLAPLNGTNHQAGHNPPIPPCPERILNEVEGPVEGAGGDPFTEICRMYRAEIGEVSPFIKKEIQARLATSQPQWFELAIGKAAAAGSRKWAYVKKILTAWEACGGPEHDHRAGKQGATNGTHRPTITGLKYSGDRYEKRADLETGQNYWWDRQDKCRVDRVP